VAFMPFAVSRFIGTVEVISALLAVFSTDTGTAVVASPLTVSLVPVCTITFSTTPPSFMVSVAFICISVFT